MSIDKTSAAAALSDIDAVGTMVRQSVFYRRASLIMILWGVLTALGYLATWLWPSQAGWVWACVYISGFIGSFAVLAAEKRGIPSRRFDWRIFAAYFLFFFFGFLWSQGIAHFTPRQMGAFWPTYFMLAYMLVGLWAGRALIVIGFCVTALTLLGFIYAGAWFEPWMAAVNGGGLVLSGLWMRRA